MLIFCHLFELYFYCECEQGHDGRECGRGNFFVAASASLICCWGVRRGAGGSGYDDGPMDTLKCIHLHQKNKTKLGKYAFGHMKVNAQTNIHICMYLHMYGTCYTKVY